MHDLLKATLGFIAIASTLAIAQESAPPHLLISTLNASQVTKGLRLSDKEVGKSDNGRIRVRWIIKELDTFEIIGNNQSDADIVAWHCGSYDKAGNLLRPVPIGSFCGKFFSSVLTNIVSSPNSIAVTLLHQAHVEGREVQQRIGGLSFETDGEFFFVRRISSAKRT